MNEPTFKDPYDHLYGEELTRLQTYVSKSDHAHIKGCRPGKGTISIVNNILWSKLSTALKNYGITDYTHLTEFEHAVANLEIALPTKSQNARRTARRPARKTA